LKKLKVFTAKIKWIEAYVDYGRIVIEEESTLVLSSMKSFESDLSKNKFVRVHKTHIINIDKIERFNSKFAEIGAMKIPLSRNKKEDLIKALSLI
jgi:two-component system LytT family response regulator